MRMVGWTGKLVEGFASCQPRENVTLQTTRRRVQTSAEKEDCFIDAVILSVENTVRSESLMNLSVTEIKAYVPARNFDLSKQFYKDIGFTMASEGGGVAYFHFAGAAFLLQDFCAERFAENFMIHLLVEDVEAWWDHLNSSGIVTRYGVRLTKIELQPWRMRDFCLADPSGVLWRIGQNSE